MKDFLVPDLGEGLEDATITPWNVAVGDDVELNQTLGTVETNKAEVEIPSPYAGRIVELGADGGDTQNVGSVLVRIATDSPAPNAPQNGMGTTRKPVLVGYGAGMHHFEKQHLEAYRHKVIHPKSSLALAKVLSAVRGAGGYEIGGATRKTVPRGFDASHERAQLLLHEGLWAEFKVTIGNEPRTRQFVDFCAEHDAAIWPVGRWIHRELVSAN